MRVLPFRLQGEGVTATELVSPAAGAGTGGGGKAKGGFLWSGSGGKEEGEPRSVLDHQRSPSPPTSSSTLSSSLGGNGGGGSTDSAGVAAVSGNPQWHPNSQDTCSAAEGGGGNGGGGGGDGRKDWAAELQPIAAAAMDIGLMSAEKCGLGIEEWEAMLSEPPPVAFGGMLLPGTEQSFMRRMIGDGNGDDDPYSIAMKLQQQQQLVMQGSDVPPEFDNSSGGAGGGFGLNDLPFGYKPIGGTHGSVAFPPLLVSGGGLSSMNSSNESINSSNGANNPNANPILPLPPLAANSLSSPLSATQGIFFPEAMEEKSQLFGANPLLNHHSQSTPFFLHLPLHAQPEQQQQHPHLMPSPKIHQSMSDPRYQMNPKVSFSDSGQDLLLWGQQQLHSQLQQRLMVGDGAAAAAAYYHQQLQQHPVLDPLLKVAELVEAGNSVSARLILARLNQQLSPQGKPVLRSAFYFKEALNTLLTNHPNGPPSAVESPLWNPSSIPSTPLEVVFKLNAYKAFSVISPFLHFTNFTCVQAILEELNGCNHVHIVDFDIGVGGQWSSFIQELSQKRWFAGITTPSLRITAFVSAVSHHPFELFLIRENLTHFASELSIPFEFNIFSIDSFDPSLILNMSPRGSEAIAVNLPVGAPHTSPPALLRLVKQLSPRIVVSVDHGCDRGDLSFTQNFLRAFNTCNFLLGSIDSVGPNVDVVSKIERFLLHPWIKSAVLTRYRAAEKIPPWRTMFISAGFVPVSFSNFTEMQAECLLKRTRVKGFHIEKRQSSLLLLWQHGELASVSAWRC